METGKIVEYIDRQRIVCAVVLESKNQRLRLLTENDREVKLPESRLSHVDGGTLDMAAGRVRLVDALKTASSRRAELSERINIREVWEILNTEEEWIDVGTMTGLCFDRDITPDHEAAVIRAFFKSRLYFKFNQDRFFPYSREHIEQMMAQAEAEARRQRLIDAGGEWLKARVAGGPAPLPIPNASTEEVFRASEGRERDFIEILMSYFLFDKESDQYDLARSMMEKAGMSGPEGLFGLFVRLGIWSPDENVDIPRMGVPTEFSEDVMTTARAAGAVPGPLSPNGHRRDLTHLRLITIDGQATQDFDDALSIEDRGDHWLLGIHIADVGHVVRPGDALDREALRRGSSIYMPDRKIPMLPPGLAEDLCSLRAEAVRPAITTMIRLNRDCAVQGYEIFPSVIRVSDQLTYYDVNQTAEERPDILALNFIAQRFRRARLENGAVHIALPEINLWLDDGGQIVVTKTNRESPSRMLVSEIMILANWLMARFLTEHGLPAVFRSQPVPKERLYRMDEGTLFQNWMQRKLLNRFVLGTSAEPHSGLGLDAYVTATSPIRKYFDLITQRQLRSAFGLDTPYTSEEVARMIHLLEEPMSHVGQLQTRRRRYWLLRYLESRVGQKEDAIVLLRRRNTTFVLLTEYMMECPIALSPGIHLKPEDVVRISIQHVNAREDSLSLSLYLG